MRRHVPEEFADEVSQRIMRPPLDSPMGHEEVRMNSELHSILTFDDEIGSVIIVLGVERLGIFDGCRHGRQYV